MFKSVKIEDKIIKKEVYPITYNKKQRMTSILYNEKIENNSKYKYPPGISILKIIKKKSINKLYNIIHNMYNKLNIPIKNGVLAYIGEERDDLKYYIPGEDFLKYLKYIKKKKR